MKTLMTLSGPDNSDTIGRKSVMERMLNKREKKRNLMFSLNKLILDSDTDMNTWEMDLDSLSLL